MIFLGSARTSSETYLVTGSKIIFFYIKCIDVPGRNVPARNVKYIDVYAFDTCIARKETLRVVMVSER